MGKNMCLIFQFSGLVGAKGGSRRLQPGTDTPWPLACPSLCWELLGSLWVYVCSGAEGVISAKGGGEREDEGELVGLISACMPNLVWALDRRRLSKSRPSPLPSFCWELFGSSWVCGRTVAAGEVREDEGELVGLVSAVEVGAEAPLPSRIGCRSRRNSARCTR